MASVASMGSLEEQAIQELVQDLVQRGDGKVWMDDWRGRFGSLGATPKEFMESRPDLFQLSFHGRGFSVELVGEGEAMAKEMGAEDGSFMSAGHKGGKAKGGYKGEGGYKGDGGYKGGIVLGAKGKGKAWGMGDDDYGGKMGGKSGGKLLYPSNPKGGINLAAPPPGKGGAYDEAGGKGSKGPYTYGGYGSGYGGGFAKGGKKGKGGAAMAALSFEEACWNAGSPEELAETAIAEITAQLQARREPKVWIEDWRDRYAHLGPSPKQFMESRPDVFTLHYEGNRYTVYLNEDGGEGGGTPPPSGGKGGKGPEEPLDEQACIDEITQLVLESSDGRIWIQDWYQRYAHLARNPRAFMESRPEVFALTFHGNSYSVAMADGSGGPPPAAPAEQQPKAEPKPAPLLKRKLPMATPAAAPKAILPTAIAPTERLRPLKAARLEPVPKAKALGAMAHGANPRNWAGPSVPKPSPTPVVPLSSIEPETSALDYLGDTEEDALAEIFDQLSKPYSNGRVHLPDWEHRFGHLAFDARAFIEGHPDKFEVVPGHGDSFTIELC